MKPESVEELKRVVLSEDRLATYGGGSKSGLRGITDGLTHLDVTGLTGILEYNPSEYTFTALAGTRVETVEKTLTENGQYLPIDPVLVEKGATLGGTVASGLSGPGRYRYGGVRDFLLGIRFMNGEGELIQGGGKVVKNAAGFDLPKLMVGSLGQYGPLVELCFKVFPKPKAFTTVYCQYPTLEQGLERLFRLANAPLDLDAVELIPDREGEMVKLVVRLGGLVKSFPERVSRLRNLLGGCEQVSGVEENAYWRSEREFHWLPEDNFLVKVPIVPSLIPKIEVRLAEYQALRHYSVGGNVAWVAWPGDIEDLNKLLHTWNLSGLVVIGPVANPLLGARTGISFARRVKKALDPKGKWVEV